MRREWVFAVDELGNEAISFSLELDAIAASRFADAVLPLSDKLCQFCVLIIYSGISQSAARAIAVVTMLRAVKPRDEAGFQPHLTSHMIEGQARSTF